MSTAPNARRNLIARQLAAAFLQGVSTAQYILTDTTLDPCQEDPATWTDEIAAMVRCYQKPAHDLLEALDALAQGDAA